MCCFVDYHKQASLIQTGPVNFLHRSWGPFEPFDVSDIELLKSEGIYTHIVTNYLYYWENRGAIYLTRYNSWEGFTGQEENRWIFVSKAMFEKITKQIQELFPSYGLAVVEQVLEMSIDKMSQGDPRLKTIIKALMSMGQNKKT